MTPLNFIKKFKKIFISLLIFTNFYTITHASHSDFKDTFYDFDEFINLSDFPYSKINENDEIKNLREHNENLQKQLETKSFESSSLNSAFYKTRDLLVLKSKVLEENEIFAKRANNESIICSLNVFKSIISKTHELILASQSNTNSSSSQGDLQSHTSIEYIKTHNLFLRNAFNEMKALIILQDSLLKEHETRAIQAAKDSRIIIDCLMRSNNPPTNITNPNNDFSSNSSSSKIHVNLPEKRKRGRPSNDSTFQSQQTSIKQSINQDPASQRKSARLSEKPQKYFGGNYHKQEE